VDKAKALADLKTPGNSLDSIEMGPMKVRVFGTTAVVTGSDTEKSMERARYERQVCLDRCIRQEGR